MIDFGREQVVDVGGKRFILSRMKLKFLRPFKDFVRREVGNPYDALKGILGELPFELARERLKAADAVKEQLECFSLQSPLAQKFLATEEGVAVLVKLLLEEHHPDVSDDEVEAVMRELDRREGLAAALATAEGETVKNSVCPAG